MFTIVLWALAALDYNLGLCMGPADKRAKRGKDVRIARTFRFRRQPSASLCLTLYVIPFRGWLFVRIGVMRLCWFVVVFFQKQGKMTVTKDERSRLFE
jgi:hypothetical protein